MSVGYFVNRTSENSLTYRQNYTSRYFTDEIRAREYYKLTVARARQLVKRKSVCIHVYMVKDMDGVHTELASERIL